jgi:hypothetical protein
VRRAARNRRFCDDAGCRNTRIERRSARSPWRMKHQEPHATYDEGRSNRQSRTRRRRFSCVTFRERALCD